MVARAHARRRRAPAARLRRGVRRDATPGAAARRGATRASGRGRARHRPAPWRARASTPCRACPSSCAPCGTRVRGELDAAGVLADVVSRVVRVYGVGELQVGAVVDAAPRDAASTSPSTSSAGEVAVRLRHGRTRAAQAQADALVAALRAAVPVFSTDGRTVDDAARRRAARAPTRPSPSPSRAPAALLGGRLTDLPGSSDYVLGGVIAYANEVKSASLGVSERCSTEHGAVSADVAEAMADGARRADGRDLRAARPQGVAGPDGGTRRQARGSRVPRLRGPGGGRCRRASASPATATACATGRRARPASAARGARSMRRT